MTTQSRRLRFTDKFGERKPKADFHLSIFGWKALGCESPIKSRIACGGQQAETLPWRLIVRVFQATDFPVGRLCGSFRPQTSRWSDCASLSGHRLPGGAIARGFQTTDFPVERLCESFTPQTSRWGDCARFSLQNHLVGVIARGFQVTDFPVERLCETIVHQETFSWVRFFSSVHRLV